MHLKKKNRVKYLVSTGRKLFFVSRLSVSLNSNQAAVCERNGGTFPSLTLQLAADRALNPAIVLTSSTIPSCQTKEKSNVIIERSAGIRSRSTNYHEKKQDANWTGQPVINHLARGERVLSGLCQNCHRVISQRALGAK